MIIYATITYRSMRLLAVVIKIKILVLMLHVSPKRNFWELWNRTFYEPFTAHLVVSNFKALHGHTIFIYNTHNFPYSPLTNINSIRQTDFWKLLYVLLQNLHLLQQQRRLQCRSWWKHVWLMTDNISQMCIPCQSSSERLN